MTFYKTPTVVQMFELIQIFNQKKSCILMGFH